MASPTLISSNIENRVANARMLELDGLRGLAISMVIFYHYAAWSPAKHSLGYYLMLPRNLGWSGVDLFFVLSGFLIGRILLVDKSSINFYRVFYGRRIYRILPLYFALYILLLLGIFFWPKSTYFSSAMPPWAYALFLQNTLSIWTLTYGPPLMGVTWSLAVEEQFYMILPVLIRKLSERSLWYFALACIFGAPLLRTILIVRGAVVWQVRPLIFCRADALAYGVLAALIITNPEARIWISKRKRLLYLACFIAGALTLSMLKRATFGFTGSVGYSFADLFYFLILLVLLVAPIRALSQAFIWSPLVSLGTISYCAYLIHEPIRYGLFRTVLGEEPEIHDRASLALTVTALIITLALAQISWIHLEKPLLAKARTRYRYLKP